MPQRPLKPIIFKQVKDNLCDEQWQDRMVASVARCEERATPFAWHDLKKGQSREPSWLNTPYGMLEVWASCKGCWTVNRDGDRLVHAVSGIDVMFTSVAA